MAKVRVWNDNVYPYQETFKGDKIYIGSKSFIEMDEESANQFRGTYSPMVLDADGNDMPQGYKMIRLEPITGEVAPVVKVDDLQCLACKHKSATKAEYDDHVKTHSSQLFVDELAEKELQAKKKARGTA
jgi:hypothetical protein